MIVGLYYFDLGLMNTKTKEHKQKKSIINKKYRDKLKMRMFALANIT